VLTTYRAFERLLHRIPIEKKPLNHFHPGTSVFSSAPAGCNLGCKVLPELGQFPSSKEMDLLADEASPEKIAEVAKSLDLPQAWPSPTTTRCIFAEYAIDTALGGAGARGWPASPVTPATSTPNRGGSSNAAMGRANVDLKSFREDFYRKITGAHLQTVLDTLVYLKSTDVWLEESPLC